MDYIKVKDKDNLYRDTLSNGIVNADEESYRNYVEAYKRQLNSVKKVDSLQNQIDEIKNDVSEIKNLLLKFIDVK
jgi:hypothetical protein